MNTLRKSTEQIALVLCLLIMFFSQTSYAHVFLIAPNGGENLEIGSTATISWEITIQHALLNWDLFYSITGAGGALIPIAIDLPAGDPTAGSVHSFDWTVPDTPSDQVRITIIMDNALPDYVDESDADFSISVPPCCFVPGDADNGGDTNIGDATFIVKYVFQGGDAPPCLDQADADGGNEVNIGDATHIVKFIFQGGDFPVCGTTGS